MDEASAKLKKQMERGPQLYVQGEKQGRIFRIRIIPEKRNIKR
jgi:hypothetical protein